MDTSIKETSKKELIASLLINMPKIDSTEVVQMEKSLITIKWCCATLQMHFEMHWAFSISLLLNSMKVYVIWYNWDIVYKKIKMATAFHNFKLGSMWIWLQRDKVFYTSKSNWYFSMIVDKIRPGSRGRRVKKGIFCCLVSTQHPFQVYWCSYLRGKLNFALGSDLLLSPTK